MSSSLPFTLFQFGPQWDLPSPDPSCLATHALLKFLQLTYQVNNCNNPRMSPTGSLPMLVDSQDADNPVVVADYHSILTHLARKGLNLDESLTNLEKAHVTAYSAMITDSLYNATLYNWWIESKNGPITQGALAQSLNFPQSWVLPTLQHHSVEKRLELTGWNSREKVYSMAATCLSSLAELLGDKQFFFGDRPSSLDALAFGHIACQLHSPHADVTLHKLVRQHPSLVRLADSLLASQFQMPPPVQADDAPLDSLEPPFVLPAWEFPIRSREDLRLESEKRAAEQRRALTQQNLTFACGALACMVLYWTLLRVRS